MMEKPRPLFTEADRLQLREFFDTPEGRRVLQKMRESYRVRPITEPDTTSTWRESEPYEKPAFPVFPSPPPEPPKGFWHRFLVWICGH